MENSMQFTAGGMEPGPEPGGRPASSRWEIFLGMLPFLLILLAASLSMLLVESSLFSLDNRGAQVVNIILRVLMVAVVLPVFILALYRKWPAWSLTWLPFFALAALALIGALASALFGKSPNFVISQNISLYVLIPLVMAVLLYSVTRNNRLRGLLAALPLLILLWWPNLEFVPVPIKATVLIPSLALACLATAFLLRRGDWRSGLYAVLAANLLVGGLFSYAGIYHGGMLPSLAPGPNLVEVARSLVPQYLAGSAILLGLLFAWKIRQSGRSGSRTARLGYHLALAGLLLVVLANLAAVAAGMGSVSASSVLPNRGLLVAAILLGLGVYLVGLFMLYRQIPVDRSVVGWARLLLQAVLPLAIPIAFALPFITSKWPVSPLYGIPLLWVLPQGLSLSIGLAWLVLSVWVVQEGK